MSWIEWYNTLQKPGWTPAPSTIGTIWTILYPIILASLIIVIFQVIRRKLTWTVLVPFLVNLVANLVFTPIQFGLRNLPLATADILVVWATIIWMMVAVWKPYWWLALVQLPYLAWVSIATVLQVSITWMNR